MRQHPILVSSALILGLLTLMPGCQGLQEPVREARESLEGRVEELGPELDELRGRLDAEIRKLRAVEYRVETLPYTARPEEIATRLSELGAERWDCFYVERTERERLLYMKRRVKTPLRGVPHSELLRHLPPKGGSGEADESGGPSTHP